MTDAAIEDLGRIFADPSAYADPVAWHHATSQLRADRPIVHVSTPDYPAFWAVTRHADVMEVERHPEVFTNAPIPVLTSRQLGGVTSEQDAPLKTLIQLDGIEHRTHRNIVNDWFKPSSVRRMQDRMDVRFEPGDFLLLSFASAMRAAGDRSPRVVNHVTTANVPGPPQHRWAGPVEVVDWISYSIAYHPANVNITAYSYAGGLSIGLVVTGVLPDPARFLRRMEEELHLLYRSLCAEGAAGPNNESSVAPA